MDGSMNAPADEIHVYVLRGLLSREAEEGLGDPFMGNWPDGDHSFLFFSEPADSRVEDLLRRQPQLALLERHRFTYEQWQGRAEIVRVAPFVIVPAWMEEVPQPGEHLIRLDPGLVFGNGVHPTTRDCLRALASAHRRISFRSVLDLGTGTGILALAAAALGATKVTAVDNNPLCVKTARRNAALNDRLRSALEIMHGPASDFAGRPADLVVANMHYEGLVEILEKIQAGAVECLILSGLMRTQARDLESHLVGRSFQVIERWDAEMTWFTLLARSGANRAGWYSLRGANRN